MIVATGLENAAPLKAAVVLFLAALGNALFRARNWDFALAVLVVAVAGISVYLFLPIRAGHFPPINEGEPTNWQAFWDVLTRQQYGKPPVSRSEEHTSELQSHHDLVCRLLLEKKKKRGGDTQD